MDYILKLEQDLKEFMTAQRGQLQVSGWYFGLNASTSLKVGLKNNELGGPYSCPKAEDAIRGKIYIIWSDNRRSVAALERNTLNNIPRMMEYWRRASYLDEDAPGIYLEDSYPNVKLYDNEVKELIDGNQDFLYQLLLKYKNQLIANGLKNITASVSASKFKQYIKNSKGLIIANDSTSFSTSVYGDETYGKAFISRRKLSNEGAEAIIEDVTNTVLSLKDIQKIQGGNMKVLLMPEITEAFINHYLVRNLNGSDVYNKRATFSEDDFTVNRQVIGEDFSLLVSTVEDYNQGSYISTYEGVAGGEIHLIKNGHLQSPILDLKYANKMGGKPTPIPTGKGSLKLYGKRTETFEEAISKIDKGIIVCSLLGMHTQDPTSGNYSLTAPNCMIIEGGKIKGGCKAVITGNFFNALKDNETTIVKGKDEAEPMLLLNSRITVD